jgi:hypothetical protein
VTAEAGLEEATEAAGCVVGREEVGLVVAPVAAMAVVEWVVAGLVEEGSVEAGLVAGWCT